MGKRVTTRNINALMETNHRPSFCLLVQIKIVPTNNRISITFSGDATTHNSFDNVQKKVSIRTEKISLNNKGEVVN